MFNLIPSTWMILYNFHIIIYCLFIKPVRILSYSQIFINLNGKYWQEFQNFNNALCTNVIYIYLPQTSYNIIFVKLTTITQKYDTFVTYVK